jgi:primosomal protein N'
MSLDLDSALPPVRRVPVLLPYPFPAPFDYAVPEGMDPQPGDVVLVPLNRRQEMGVVWDGPPDATVPNHKIKPLISLVDTPPMAEPLRRLVDWMASYTLSPPGEVMAMAPPAGDAHIRCRKRARPRLGRRCWQRWRTMNL